MPVYQWKNEEGKIVEVLKPFDQYNVPPTKEEALEYDPTITVFEFEKIVCPVSKKAGDSWGGWGKGQWGSR